MVTDIFMLMHDILNITYTYLLTIDHEPILASSNKVTSFLGIWLVILLFDILKTTKV